ncbi:MAG: tRNA (adenosine(37)-N6)-threonylcarbamoyltransferase complex transferase subunit TsaD [Deferribacteraceae bacterium]|jgi:N6-L-threonylcarbamoyladenine synthase|nr:tRNA (adenosine(37)-N6)-threonylcarbamoyltransferase complex transferase subunit TsaD [Deferribacteraceae bacterium]
MIIRGIETSCDETSIALLKVDGSDLHTLSLRTYSQADIHAVFGGVVPEVASRNHMQKIIPLYQQTIDEAGIVQSDIDIISVTNAPGLIGALFVGVAFAKGLGYALKKPVVPIHHLSGHILSGELDNPSLKPPYIAMVASGGHTHIYDVNNPLSFTLWGRTIDDAAGEAFDKVAKMIGGKYPGGPFIERLALEGNPLAIKFPIALRDTDNFCFSGLKTAVLTAVNKKEFSNADIAASFQHTVAVTLTNKLIRAAKTLNRDKIVLAGGVACNGYIRKYLSERALEEGITVHLPSIALCNDNALMIAYAAYRITQGQQLDKYSDLGFAAGDTRHNIDV